MLKKLKNYQVLDLMEAFTRIGKMQVESNKKFSYALILNDDVLKSQVEAVMKIAEPSPEYAEFENERTKIIEKYAELDGDGKVVLKDNQWVVFKEESKEEAIEALNKLNDENKDILDKRNKDIEEYNEILDTEVEVNITTVSIDDVPEKIGEDMFLLKLLMPMID